MAIVLNPKQNNSSSDNSNEKTIEDAKKERQICRIYVDESIEKQIILDELSGQKTGQENSIDEISNENVAGREFPVIKIGDFFPNVSQIQKMVISSDGRVPTISLSMMVESTHFRSKNMPKDGEILSIFIAPKTETLASIRNDYIITSVGTKKVGGKTKVNISGTLFIPGFTTDTSFGVVGTSKTAFIETAKKFGLGFATDDEEDTNDKQLWICSNTTALNFLNDTITHVWKDEMSFFDWWVDEHYNINLINVNKMLLENKSEFDITANSQNLGMAYEIKEDYSQDNTVAVNKVFSNDERYARGVFRVKKWNPYNNSSQISINEGVEIKSNEFQHNPMIYADLKEPVLTLSNVPAYDPEKVDNHILLRGRPEYDANKNPEGEQARANYNFKDIYVKKPWCGISYVMSDEDNSDNNNEWAGNVNKNYTRAPYHNKINLDELEKMYIIIEVDGLCTQVMRGEVVPVALKKDASESALTPDSADMGERFYNGFYYVQSVTYTFTSGNPCKFETKFKLTKREWPIPVDYEEPKDNE